MASLSGYCCWSCCPSPCDEGGCGDSSQGTVCVAGCLQWMNFHWGRPQHELSSSHGPHSQLTKHWCLSGQRLGAGGSALEDLISCRTTSWAFQSLRSDQRHATCCPDDCFSTWTPAKLKRIKWSSTGKRGQEWDTDLATPITGWGRSTGPFKKDCRSGGTNVKEEKKKLCCRRFSDDMEVKTKFGSFHVNLTTPYLFSV